MFRPRRAPARAVCEVGREDVVRSEAVEPRSALRRRGGAATRVARWVRATAVGTDDARGTCLATVREREMDMRV
jgi:hypothetical protein